MFRVFPPLALSLPGPGGPGTRGERMGVFIHFPVITLLESGSSHVWGENTKEAVSAHRERTENMNVEGLPGRELKDDQRPHI